MAYVDGFVLPVQADRLNDYKKIARLAGKVWREHGALDYVECVADDVPVGKLTSFTRAVKLKEGEIVVFAFIVYKSRKDRDAINKKVMADPRITKVDPKTLPIDGKRMIFGGFKEIVRV